MRPLSGVYLVHEVVEVSRWTCPAPSVFGCYAWLWFITAGLLPCSSWLRREFHGDCRDGLRRQGELQIDVPSSNFQGCGSRTIWEATHSCPPPAGWGLGLAHLEPEPLGVGVLLVDALDVHIARRQQSVS